MSKDIHISDEKLLHLYCTDGETRYFGELYLRYVPMVYGVGLKYFGNEKEAEVATEELLDCLLKVMREEEEPENFKKWLYVQMRQFFIDRLNERAGTEKMDCNGNDDSYEQYFGGVDDIDYRSAEALRCISVLTDKHRSVVQRFFIDGLSYGEIVSTTGFALGQVKGYVFEGLQKLKVCVNKRKHESER